MNNYSDLIELSLHYGSQPGHVQAGGGNTSQKHADGTITIKASGCLLSEVSRTKGFVTLARGPIVEFFDADKPGTEAGYDAVIHSLIKQDSPRPSMESGFHAALPGKFVLHTHSVWAGILTCADEGNALLRELKQDYCLVPYLTPGIPLSHYIRHLKVLPHILFLQNHGLIVHGDSVEEVRHIYNELHESMQALLGAEPYPVPDVVNGVSATSFPFLLKQENLFSSDMDQILTPDQAIYFSMRNNYTLENGKLHYNVSDHKAKTYEQAALFVSFLLDYHHRHNWQTRYISPEHIARLLHLGSEKYRQQEASS